MLGVEGTSVVAIWVAVHVAPSVDERQTKGAEWKLADAGDPDPTYPAVLQFERLVPASVEMAPKVGADV
jgi:hypothetical protein